jgi:FkbM family methyltransferase
MNIKALLIALASKFGMYFSKQPKKFDLLKAQLRSNLLSNSKGVLHIGAHFGQESAEYADHNLKVIWIEAADTPFYKLEKNIKKYKNQLAIKALVGNANSKTKFYTASNNASSSIYRFGKDMPHGHLEMIDEQEMKMNRLDTLFSKQELKDFNYWVIDVQGAEYLVLLGAGTLLEIPNVIEIEVSTRDEYENASKFNDIDKLLKKFKFQALWKPDILSHEDLIYVRLT